MSQFLENAREIFEAAESSAAAGHTSCQYTILLDSPTNGIHLIADSDWTLDALKREHGAKAAYRVSNVNGRIRVEGMEGQRICHLEATPATKTARFLLNAAPAWHERPSYIALLA